ncbi:hypothetical protein Tco_0321357 [Tanacetum coccineum]
MQTALGDGIVSIKRRCQDLQDDGVVDFEMTSARGRVKMDPELSNWRRRDGDGDGEFPILKMGMGRGCGNPESRDTLTPNQTMNTFTMVSRIHPTNSNGLKEQFQLQKVVQKQLQKGIDNDIYSIVDACPNTCEMWKALERLKQGESINVQDLETNLYWEFGKHKLSRDEWQRFVMLVKQSQELKIVSYHKLYDILKQHQNEVNELKAERLARTANLLALVAQQQLVYHPQNHPTYYTHNSSTRTQQAATRNRGKAIEKEIDKLMALISLSFKKIYKPTNNNLRTSSNTSRANQDNSLRINRGTGYDNQRAVNVAWARENVAKECQKPKRAKDAAYHKEKMLLSYYLYMAQIQKVSPDTVENPGPIFDAEPLQKVQNNDDNYIVFANDRELPEKPESVNDTYLVEHDDSNVIIDSLDMSNNEGQADHDDDDLARERDLLASLIEKLKCEINDNKNPNKFWESSNKTLVDKLKGEIEDFKKKKFKIIKFQRSKH